jgi:hypothetical protein
MALAQLSLHSAWLASTPAFPKRAERKRIRIEYLMLPPEANLILGSNRSIGSLKDAALISG